MLKYFDIIIVFIGMSFVLYGFQAYDRLTFNKLKNIQFQLENQQKLLDVLNKDMYILQNQSQELLNYYKKFNDIYTILRNENPYNTESELSEITNAIITWSQCKDINENLFIALIIIESGINHNVVSSVGAKGVMQLMDFHLVNYIKEPTIDEHIMEGAKYLKYLINNYGEVGGLKRYLCGESNRKCINSREASNYYWKIKNKQIKL